MSLGGERDMFFTHFRRYLIKNMAAVFEYVEQEMSTGEVPVHTQSGTIFFLFQVLTALQVAWRNEKGAPELLPDRMDLV